MTSHWNSFHGVGNCGDRNVHSPRQACHSSSAPVVLTNVVISHVCIEMLEAYIVIFDGLIPPLPETMFASTGNVVTKVRDVGQRSG